MWRLVVVWSSMLKTKKGVQVDNMLKRSLVLVLLAVFCLAVNVSAAELVLKPLEDTYIRDGGDAANNFGNADVLQLKWESDRGGMTRTVFLKFDISEIENVERATLRLFMELNDVLEMKHIALYDITGVEWSENTLTWETAPKTGGEHIRDVFTDNFANVWLEIN
ncbi:MAG: DNRLRE domain-containing protein, partial [Limnochordia bacterium]